MASIVWTEEHMQVFIRHLQQERENRRIVLTNGVFDVLHAGHLHVLTFAKALGDVLIVAVDSDANVRRLKGEGRPIFPQHNRMSLLAALRVVDAVLLLERSELLGSLLRTVHPHVYVKGSDYMGKRLDIMALLQELGIAYELDPVDVGSHTSAIIAHICQQCGSG
jgi:D-beta-D-heptose 7-phosphate kinase / D-beta-D-heptose 1-phosphate adenosyltransferase